MPPLEAVPAGSGPGLGSGSETAAWYAVQVKPHREDRVAHHLLARSVPAFLPLIESVHRAGGARRIARLEPLFPGYLFVSMESWEHDPERWQAVRWSPGVRRILGTPDAPLPVPDEAMAIIRAQVRDLGFVRPGTRFAAGDRVRIRYGPFAHLEAVFDRPVGARGRVRVLLQLLGQRPALELDELELEPA